MAQSSVQSVSKPQDPLIGKKISDLQSSGAKIEDFNPVGMKISDLTAKGVSVSDVTQATPTRKSTLPKPVTSPESTFYTTAEGLKQGLINSREFAAGIAGELGYDPKHPIVGTLQNILGGLASSGAVSSPTATMASPERAAALVKNIMPFWKNLASNLYQAGKTGAEGAVDLAAPGTFPNALEESGSGARAGGHALPKVAMLTGAGSEPSKSALPAADNSLSNLSSVIQSGIKQGTGHAAAETYQPFIQSFLKKSGVASEDILPNKGDVASLIRGGSVEQLGRLNRALLDQHVAVGRTPESFTPATSVHMAIAQGAINEAHAPIANAVNAVREARIDGSMEGVPNIQQNIVAKLLGEKKKLSPSQMKEMGGNYDAAIADVLTRGRTIGGLDLIRQNWNEGMNRFYNGTPGQISNADASAAAVWKAGNDIIRGEMYPTLESMTKRGGAGADLAEAGRREAVAISAMDGVYKGWVKEANLTDNVAIENYLKYVTEGPESLIAGVRSPSSTVLGMAKRAVTPRTMPISEFNQALRKGFGNMSDAVRMDASAFPNRDVTSTEPFGYPRATGQARGAGTTGGLPGSLTPTPPAPAAQPPVYNTTGTPTVTSGSLPGSLTMQKEAVGSPLQPSGPAAASAGPSGQRAASLAPYGAPEQAVPATGITYEGTPNVTSGELPSSLTPTKPTPPTGIPTGKATVTSGELPQSLAPKPKEPVKQDYPEGRGPSKAPAAKKTAKSYMESLMEEFGLDVPHGGGVKAPTPPSKK